MLSRNPKISTSLLIVLFLGSLCHGCYDEHDYCPAYETYCETDEWTKDNCHLTCGCKGPSWTACTKSCGGGSRYTETCNGTQCEREYKACNTQSCVPLICNYGEEQRKGMPHACCSKNYNDSRRIVFGELADLREWPWVMALIYWKNQVKEGLCGGALISSKYVLTAAHCFDDYPLKSGWRVYSGILRLSEAETKSGIRIHNIQKTSDYDYPYNDIALVKLKQTVPSTATVQPISLPRGEITPEDTTCFVAGWGISHHTNPGEFTNHQQHAPLKIVNPWICKKLSTVMPDKAEFLAKLQGYICAGGANGQADTCPGDSGSPLVCQRCSSCAWYVAAVVSFGHPSCGTFGYPAVYTKVLHYEIWIKSIIKSKTENLQNCTYNKVP